jgi:hypothetical protein
MKKYIIIIGIFFITLTIFAVPGNDKIGKKNAVKYALNISDTSMDTLSYLKTFIDNKQNYINKELSVLLNDLNMPVLSYITSGSDIDRTISPSITISFLSRKESSIRRFRKPHSAEKLFFLVIDWKTPLKIDDINSLMLLSKGEWLNGEKEFFGKQIVGDIRMIR